MVAATVDLLSCSPDQRPTGDLDYDASRWAVATLTVVVLGVAFLLAWVLTGRPLPPTDAGAMVWIEPLVTICSYGVAGALLLDRRPDLPFGWLLAGTACLVSIAVATTYPAAAAVVDGERDTLALLGLTTGSFAFLPIAVQGMINVRFPSGRPASRAGAALEVAIATGTGLVLVGGFLGGSLGGVTRQLPDVRHPWTGGTAVGAVADGLVILGPLVVLLGLIAGLGVIWRFVRARGLARQQLRWRAAGVVAAVVLFPFAVTDHLGFLNAVDAPLFVLTLVVPVLRYRLWAIDRIVRRSVAYGLVTVVLVLGYLAVTAAVAGVASERVAAPIAAATVAMSFEPVRRVAQRLVDRMFYGDRSDPYRTLRELGRRLNSRPDGDLLVSLVEAVASSLRLPYVAIEGTDGTALAAWGVTGPTVQRWPLAYEQNLAGFLVAAPRRGEDSFDEPDRELIGDIAGQIGVAVHAVGLTAELLRSRQRLVSAREEERRRLRRDLHDGLGPVLTAVGLTLDAARATARRDPPTAEQHIADAKEATTQALTDLRRLVHGLRPPVLDDLGLTPALRAQADRLCAGSALSVTIDAGELPDLPAAVEVAAFRIAVEAVTNARRHSDATRCHVQLAATDGELSVRVHDNGTVAEPWTPGVGLATMRERAEELGGTLRAGPEPAGGATVAARLPLPSGSTQ